MNIPPEFARKPTLVRLTGLWLWLAVSACPPVHAQITFNASAMLTVIGDYSQEYIGTNMPPLGTTGGPQLWDFSQAPQPQDYIRRLDIVPPTDGGNQASFPDASYAERYTDGVSIFQDWDYYSLTTNIGRIYYGSYNANSGTQVFRPPSADIPMVLGYGSNWSYTISATQSPLTFQDTVTASVDAYGTVVLPQIGAVQALRVNELTEQQELLDSNPVLVTYIREYFWLVPGIGKAVDILSSTSSIPPPANFTSAGEVRRVFESNSLNVQPRGVADLQIQVQHGSAILHWLAVSNVSGYQVQAIDDLTLTNWQILGSPASNSWAQSATATRQFYRVFVEP